VSKYLIKAIVNTVLKRYPVDSSTLPDDQKQSIAAGTEIYAITYDALGNNFSFFSMQDSYLGKWYGFSPHVEVFEDGKLILPDLITFDQLKRIAIFADLDRVAKLLPYLNSTMQRYEINTPLRIAHFLAQTAHESDGFNTNREYASGEDYEWRTDLGNTQAGDGARFRGRGLIQVTGRANVRECGEALGIDLISNPERLEDFDLACLSAGWFWDKHKLNAIADRDDVNRITRIINGGTNGLADRIDYLESAKAVLMLM
jgi:putative chitinase